MVAKPSVHFSGSMISLFADETGIIRTFQGNRLAVASDGGVTPAENFLGIQSCLNHFIHPPAQQNKKLTDTDEPHFGDRRSA